MNNRYRLNRIIEPLSYDITLEPDLKRFTFTGEEVLRVRARSPFSRVTLHAIELKIKSAALRRRPGGAALKAKRISYDTKLETTTLDFGVRLPASSDLVLELAFSGAINDKMHGFYRTSYEMNGRRRWGGATQFEATDARRAFPCWDEPDKKAVFTLTLRVPRFLTALSNMPIQREHALPGSRLREIRYASSPRMSTYLLAWVIADLECVSGLDCNNVPVRVWTTPGKQVQGRFALDTGRRSLEYFARWFGIPYALPKLDMVALPDFAAGAMENWGLVTYRETTLLVHPKQSSAQARQRVAEVVAHELAHQWFGNLVTMEWWTDLWLNEGFASYMDPKSVNTQFPRWQVWNQFVAGEHALALHDDSLKNSHPIEIPVRNPHEIREIFDHITYNKGSAVNRMLEHYLTEPVFRRGLSQYLKRYAYRNARTRDLWGALEQVSGKPVRSIMANYTRLDGYPVVSVKTAGPGKIQLEQRRFFFDGSRGPRGRFWRVPIVAAAQGSSKLFYGLLAGQRAALALPTEGWVKVNAGHSGFYRTSYSPELLTRLTQAISKGDLSSLDCLGLLDDTLALARAGELRTSQALFLAAVARRYSDYPVCATISGILGSVNHILDDKASREQLAVFGRALFGPLAAKVGWEPRKTDGHMDALLRTLVIGRMGHFHDLLTVAQARERFERLLKGGTLWPDLQGPVYSIVAENGGTREFEQLLRVYRKAAMQEERVRVLRALTYFREQTLIRKVLDFSLTKEVRAQDAYMILGGFGHNPEGRDLAWAFVKQHWKTLVSRFSNGGLRMMVYIIEGAASGLTTPAALDDLRVFFARHPVPSAERTMKQSLEVVAATVRWARRDASDIRRWLEDESGRKCPRV
jgi:puromycin-sensitive aminopeptidase